MMAIAILYALPPIAVFYGLRRFMTSGLTAGGIKG
jgi:ABC-type maltose transport system permease subunit